MMSTLCDLAIYNAGVIVRIVIEIITTIMFSSEVCAVCLK